MRPRTLIPLLIGLGVGFFAIKMGIGIVQKAKAGQGDAVDVFVTARPIEVATRITEPMLTAKLIPQGLVPADAFTDSEALTGRVTAMSITAGVPITQGMLAPPGAEPGLRAKIPANHRAVSISVTEESAVAGFVTPGSRVDVLAGSCSGKSQLLLSDVEVGAVGQSMNEVGADGKTVRITKSVTLFLKPDQVQVLPAGRKNLRLALRGNARDPVEGGQPFWSQVAAKVFERSSELRRIKKAPSGPEAPPAPRRHVVEVVRGSEVKRLVFVESSVPGKYELADQPSIGKEMRAGFGESDDPSDMEIDE